MGFAAPQGEPCSGRYDRRDRGLQSRMVRSIRALAARAFWSVAVPLDPQQLTKMHGECRMAGRTRRCEGVSAWVAIAPAAEVYGRRAVAQQGERARSSEVGPVQLRGHASRGGEMAFHTQRGHEVPDGTKSCTYCGAPIVGGPAAGGRGDARDGRHRDVARRHGGPSAATTAAATEATTLASTEAQRLPRAPQPQPPQPRTPRRHPRPPRPHRRLPSQPTPLHLRNPLGGLAVASRIVQAAGRASSCQSAQDRPASLIAKHPVDDVFLTDAVAISHTDAIKRKQSLRIVVIDRPERCQLPFERCGI